jgi:HEAT repeat protein
MGEQYSPLLAGEGQGERFACASESQRGEELIKKLQETGKERIRELVRNPLRLSLLCQTSYLLPVDEPLPETKAALYERFTRYFYEWKQEQHLDLTQQDELIDELHEALGKLALAGINSAARFRLGRKFARQQMGERLFNLACRLGWLNLVDREAKTDEAVYAFFHPTFQEYFAACAIDDWRYFLNHDNENPNPLLNPNSSLEYDDGKPTYRIFEPRWKEVFLLWMGRDSTEVPNEFKEQFIQALIEFNEGIEPFLYKHRAFFLATAAMAELANFHWGDAIVAHLVKGGFGHFSTKEQKWVTFFEPIAEAARLALQETEPIKAVDALVNLIQNCNDKNIQWKAIYSLGQVGRGNPMAVKAIVEFIQQSQDENTRHSAAQILGRIDKGNLIAADTLIKLIGNSQETSTRQWAADSLAEIGVGNQITVDALVELTRKSHDEDVRRLAAYCLGKIDKDNPTAIATLKDISLESQDEDICWRTVECIGKIGEGNRKAVDALVEVTRKYQDGFVRWLAAKSLWKIDKGSEIAITAFIDLIRNSQDKITQREAAKSLGEIGKGNPKAVTTLAELIENSQNEFTRSQVAYCLGQVNNGNPTAINAREGLIRKSEYEEIRRIAAVHLGQVDNGNPTAIDALEGLIRKSEYEEIRRIAAVHLGQADKGKSKAIPALEDLSLNSKNDYIRNKAAHNLEQIDKGNPTAIAALIDLIQNPQHEETVGLPILSLEIIGAGNSTAITALVELIRNPQHGSIRRHAIDCLKRICAEVQMAEVVTLLKDYLSYQTYENDFQRFSDCYEVIWHCAQNIPYPSFYQAWHQPTTQ